MTTDQLSPGRYDGLTYAEYDAIDAIRSSDLKCSTALEYLARTREPQQDNDTLRGGRAVHTAYLEPQQFLREYALQPPDIKQKRGKAWEAFAAANVGKTVLTEKQYQDALAIGRAVRECPETADRLIGAATEVTLVWVDPRTGLRCKARLDVLRDGLSLPEIDDLKTTSAPNPRQFGISAARYGYHLQLAFYGYGYSELFGVWPKSALIVAQSTGARDVWLVEGDDDAIELGCDLMHERLAMVAGAKRSGSYPGHASGKVLSLSELLPRWAQPEDGIILEDEEAA